LVTSQIKSRICPSTSFYHLQIKDLIQKAIREEKFVLSHVKLKLAKSCGNSIKNQKEGVS
jgi:hypothetical protein